VPKQESTIKNRERQHGPDQGPHSRPISAGSLTVLGLDLIDLSRQEIDPFTNGVPDDLVIHTIEALVEPLFRVLHRIPPKKRGMLTKP
jgi:hypothetical protein